MDKQKLFDAAVQWAKRKGFTSLRANTEGYEAPGSYRRMGSSEEEVQPDMTGKKLGAKSYIEISLKTEQISTQISKFKLLSTLAAAKGGKLFILSPRGHKAFNEKLVKDHNLPATVVNI